MFVIAACASALSSCNSFDDLYLSASCRPAVIKVNDDNKYVFTYDGTTLTESQYFSLKTGKLLVTSRYRYNDKNQIDRMSLYTDTTSVASSYHEYQYDDKGLEIQDTEFKRSASSDNYVQVGYTTFKYDNKGFLIRESEFDGTNTESKVDKTYTYDSRNNKKDMRLKYPLKDEYLAESYVYDDNKGIDSSMPIPLKGDKNNLLQIITYDPVTGKQRGAKRYYPSYASNASRYPVKYVASFERMTYDIEYLCR